MGFNDLRKRVASADGGESVSITSPVSTFGDLSIAEMIPTAQGDFVYSNINPQIFTTSSFGTGTSVTSVNGMCNLDSGTDASGSATVQLRRGVKYRSGQGSMMRGTALFDTPSAGNAQFIGLGNAECGYFVGYFGTSFGVLHQSKNRREIRKLTITTATISGDVTITLDDEVVTFAVTATTTTQAAYLIANHDFSQVAGGGWLTDVVGSDVYFITARSRQTTGTYSATYTGSPIGTFSVVQAGLTTSPDFIPSGSFNIDKLDGSGPSGMTLDTSKGNVFQIGFQYLGFGNAKFAVEDPETGFLHNFHEIKNANARTTPVVVNPNVSVLATSANIGGTDSKVLRTASLSAFNEGMVKKLDPRYSNTIEIPSGNFTSFKPLAIIKANRILGSESSFGEFDIIKIAVGNDTASSSPKTIIIALFLEATVTGDVNFVNVDSDNSIVSIATLSPSTQTINNVANLAPFYQISAGAGSVNTIDLSDLEFSFGPSQKVVVAVKTTGNASGGTVSINWFEQQ